jgi:hypothetical protein
LSCAQYRVTVGRHQISTSLAQSVISGGASGSHCTMLQVQEEDKTEHVQLPCVYSRPVWFKVLLSRLKIDAQRPSCTDQLSYWWASERRYHEKTKRKGFDSIVILIRWRLSKHRDAWVFGNVQKQWDATKLSRLVVEKTKQWRNTLPSLFPLVRTFYSID